MTQFVTGKVISIVVFVIVVTTCGPNKQMQKGNISSARLNDSVLVDGDGNTYPLKVLLDGNLWMTANLKLNILNSYCYENIKNNCDQYGRLYTWESANEGCKLLGDRWRLPTKGEWGQLTTLYGGIAEDSGVIRKGAYKALLNTGNAGFNALLGGGRSPDIQYSRLDAHGFYWTATKSEGNLAVFYNFAKGSQALFQQNAGEKEWAFSVRCVKTIDSLK